MDEPELRCLCGYENFERVVVQRKVGHPLETEFVACIGCRAMYWAPLPRLTDPPPPALPQRRPSWAAPEQPLPMVMARLPVLPSQGPEWSEDDTRKIKEAAAKAAKHRKHR